MKKRITSEVLELVCRLQREGLSNNLIAIRLGVHPSTLTQALKKASLTKGHKYGARKTRCNRNEEHPSALEASVCNLLQLRERAKEIRDLKWIAPVDLFYTVAGKEKRVRWKVDFSFIENRSDTKMWAEAKGPENYDYKRKKELWEDGAGPGPLEIWKGDHARPRIVQIIVPKGKA